RRRVRSGSRGRRGSVLAQGANGAPQGQAGFAADRADRDSVGRRWGQDEPDPDRDAREAEGLTLVLAGRVRLRVDPQGDDPVFADRLDPDLVASGPDRVAALRQPSELVEDVAADRVVGVGVHRQLDAGIVEVAERDVAAHVPVAVGELADPLPTRIGLVLDLPDDLLEDVFNRGDPDSAAVLVDDDRDRAALPL